MSVCPHVASRVLVYSLQENSEVGSPPVFPGPCPGSARGSPSTGDRYLSRAACSVIAKLGQSPALILFHPSHPRLGEKDGHVSPLDGLCALGVQRFSEAFLVRMLIF